MNKATVLKLNQLNIEFYTKVAHSFSATRQSPWPGWEKCWEKIEAELLNQQAHTPLRILDVGCGNGRFGKFVSEKLNGRSPLEYDGFDQDWQLLEYAKESFAELEYHNPIESSFSQIDLLERLHEDEYLSHTPFDVVACFGVFHHVPSAELRLKFVKKLAQSVDFGGLLLISLWQFDRNSTLVSRAINPAKIGLSPNDLEENDYFLTWERDTSAIRYCHLVTKEEQDELIHASGLQLVDRYSADGKSDDHNEYLILQKNLA